MARAFGLFILIFLLFIYRQAIFGHKIVFPANYLASFYSPWSTEKFPGWEQGIPHKPLGSDQLRFFYPNRTFTNQEILAGRLPLWNPYVFAGNPFLANFQSAVFYPLNLLYLLLPQLFAWSILIIVQPFLATIFCYLFLSCFPIKKLARFFGAFAFGFSGFIVTWSQEAMAVGQTVIWLPLILYGIEKRRFWVATLALTCSILAGYLQTTVYISVFIFAYAIYRRYELKKIVLIFLMAAGLSAIQLVPSLEAFSVSARPTSTIEKVFDTYLLPVTHLVKLIAPDINGNPGAYNFFGKGSYNETVLYIGLVPLVFAIFSFVKKRGNQPVKFFAISAILTFILTSDFFLTRWFLHLPLPLVPTFQPSRILILTTFCLAVLSAYGFSKWLEEPRRDNKTLARICLGLLAPLLILLIYYKFTLWSPSFLVALKNSVLPVVTLVILFLVLRLRFLAIPVILLLTILGQWYFFNKYLVLGDEQFLYPDNKIFNSVRNLGGTDRFIAFGKPILENFATQFNIYSPEGYDPIFSRGYGQLIYSATDFNNGKLVEDIPRIEVMMSALRATDSGQIVEGLFDNDKRTRLLNLLAVKNIFYYDETGWQYIENKKAHPRTFLAGEIIVENDPQQIIDEVYSPRNDLGKTVILEESPNVILGTGTASATISLYEPQRVEIKTAANDNKILFLSDNYYPGWQATVDGSSTKIYRADFAFRSVVVPAGNHLVKFTYQPRSFEIGKDITLLTLLFLGLQNLLILRRRT